MKDIILSGVTYSGVEQVHFNTPSGDRATFVDADTKKEKMMTCSISCRSVKNFNLVAVVPQAIPTTSISFNLEG